jgi:hypothetical protein
MSNNLDNESLNHSLVATDSAATQCRELMQSLSSEEKRQLLCTIIKELYGPRMDKEALIWDEDKTLYAYLLPPGERFRLHLLENPQLAEELNRRSQAPGTTRLSDLIQRLREQYP